MIVRETDFHLDSTHPISCLTQNSFETFSSTADHLDIFIEYLSNDTSDMSMEYDRVISIISNCNDLMNYIKTYQDLFLEYAIDDYLLLDEHLHSIYEKVLRILHDLHQLTSINSEVYKFEKDLLCYLPSTYIHRISSSFTKAITTTLIEQTARLFTSTSNALFLNDDDDDNDCIITSSFLFSTCPLPINADKDEITHQESHDQSKSLLQLDKINLRTAMLTQSQLTPAFQFDLTDLEQIEDDLSKNFIEEKKESRDTNDFRRENPLD